MANDIKDLLGAEAGNEAELNVDDIEELKEELIYSPALEQEGIDPIKQATANVLTMITNNYYKHEDAPEDIQVVISTALDDTGKKNTYNNYYDQRTITLADGLMTAFEDLNLPRFSIYYHELGHHLYSQGLFELNKAWVARLRQAYDPIGWDEKYMHLQNWLEDFYIESKMIQDLPYTTDVLTCIKQLPPDYNINELKYAFNYYYIHGAVTPALNHTDGISFLAYVKRLYQLRNVSSTRFGKGPLSVLTATGKLSTETQYVKLLIEFYNWCVTIGIFDPTMPPAPQLDNPYQHIEAVGGDGDGSGDGSGDGDDTGEGSTSDHSNQVGKSTGKTWKVAQHITTPVDVFKDQLTQEYGMLKKELLDMSQRLQIDNATTLDGLFNSRDKDSTFIQSKIIIPNFFNPARLLDMVLFREKEHVYTNVAIYRDISGSVSDKEHKLMSDVCDLLIQEIPVEVKYYLYSSGKVSIVEVPYISWDDKWNVPPVYDADPLYKQLQGGTNSDAIADAITEQLSDNWLNIIVTDGDLHALMKRSNIEGLLKNVFVVHVSTYDKDVTHNLLGVLINDDLDIAKVIPTLATISG